MLYSVIELERREWLITCMVGKGREEGVRGGFIDLRILKDERS